MAVILSWPQCVNSLWLSDTIWRDGKWLDIVSGSALLPDGTKPLPEPLQTCIKPSTDLCSIYALLYLWYNRDTAVFAACINPLCDLVTDVTVSVTGVSWALDQANDSYSSPSRSPYCSLTGAVWSSKTVTGASGNITLLARASGLHCPRCIHCRKDFFYKLALYHLGTSLTNYKISYESLLIFFPYLIHDVIHVIIVNSARQFASIKNKQQQHL